MTKFMRTLSRALSPRADAADRDVHFHGGPHGAYVCENATCVSPSLDPIDR